MSTAQPTMRRVVVGADKQVVVDKAAVPVPAATEALVQAVRAGVCGSDVHAVHGRHPFIALPYMPGHEVIGRVVQLGPEALRRSTRNGENIELGQRVIVEPTLPCWSCKQCRRGQENLCENLAFFGCVHSQGGLADYFTVPVNRLHGIPDDLDDDQAVLIEPLSTPVHAVRISGLRPGQSVAILGAGTIGLMTLAAARRAGAGRIVVTDIVERKRAAARRLGADAAVDAAHPDLVTAVRAELEESADVVFDCVAIQSTMNAAIGMALKNGTVVVVGVPAADVTIPLPIVQDQQIRIQGSATYLPADYAVAVEMLRAGDVRPAEIITAVYPLDRAADAFEAASSGDHVKVVVAIS